MIALGAFRLAGFLAAFFFGAAFLAGAFLVAAAFLAGAFFAALAGAFLAAFFAAFFVAIVFLLSGCQRMSRYGPSTLNWGVEIESCLNRGKRGGTGALACLVAAPLNGTATPSSVGTPIVFMTPLN